MGLDRWLRVAALGATPLCVGGYCEDVPLPDEPPLTFDVALVNDAPGPVHIAAPGESFSEENRILPGESRLVALEVDDGPGYLFRAGRNGRQLTANECTRSSSADESGELVIYSEVQDGANVLSSLACTNW